MELHAKLSVINALKQRPELCGQLLDKKHSEGAKSQLAELSNLSLNFIEINFNQVKLLVFAQTL